MPKSSISKICTVNGCNKKHLAKGLCSIHYDRMRYSGRLHRVKARKGEHFPCTVDGCYLPIKGKGYCDKHYQRSHIYGRLHTIRREKGTGTIIKHGYLMHGSGGRMMLEHRIIAESALGHALPKGAVIHHVDEDTQNNRSSNLVICPNQKYHALLHIRQGAYAACGNAEWRRCWICKKYDSPENVTISISNQAYHKKCNAEYARRLKSNA